MELTCPNCRARLDEDLAESTGEAECPFCGADVAGLLAESAEAGASESAGLDDPRSPPPGLLQLVEWSDDRLVVAIPPGGSAMKGMGCFSVLWLGITGAATAGFGGAALRDGFDWEIVIPFLVLGVFWLVGFGMAYAWYRSRNLTTYLLLERDRLAVQRILFGRKSTKVTTLTADSRASLETSFSQNDEPVYHVELKGSDRTEKFGLRLDDPDKDWLVRAFNAFLHDEDPAARVARGGHGETGLQMSDEAPTEAVAPMRPHELPSDSSVRIDDTYVDGLRFSVPTLTGLWSSGCGYGCGCFGSLWFLGCASFVYFALAANAGIGEVIMPIILSVMGLAATLVGTWFRLARTTVQVEPDGVTLRWGIGPLRVARYLPNESITHVGLGTTMESRTGDKVTYSQQGAVIRADGKSHPLTINHGLTVARQVGGLLRAELEDRGVRLEELNPPKET